MAATSMKAIATASMAGESQWAKLASCEEKPPSPIVVNPCIRASSPLMPASQ
jgi:hypothetical protein